MKIGICAMWECMECGKEKEISQIITEEKTKCSFNKPKRCSCSKKDDFKLIRFKQMNVKIDFENVNKK